MRAGSSGSADRDPTAIYTVAATAHDARPRHGVELPHRAGNAVSPSGDGKTEHVSRSDAAALDAADDQYLSEADRFHQDITMFGGGARTLHRARAEREPGA